ncbi:MAG: BrnT family toxin, partial [Candidatus Latescibacteria bacterium]|nr:BrnT family toxin [Candidatus Latescibacterota bacterium]
MQNSFEWDPPKSEQNIRKHKVSFQRAATVFRDPNAISIFDEEHSQQEDRWIPLGRDTGGILLL